MTRSFRCSVSTREYPASFILCLSPSLSLCPLFPPLLSLSLPNMTLCSYSVLSSRVSNIIDRECASGVACPAPSPPFSPPLRRSLIGRFIPESPDSSTAPCSLLSSCCAVNRWCFFFTLAEEKNNWTDRKVKAVVLLCYSGENNGDLCAIIFFAKCSRLFSTKVMILKHLCSKYLMFWKNCENMHAFHSLWWVL